MIDLLEKILTGLANFIDTVVNFFVQIVTLLTILGDTVIVAFRLFVAVTQNGGLNVVLTLVPAFMVPFSLFVVVKAVIALVT